MEGENFKKSRFSPKKGVCVFSTGIKEVVKPKKPGLKGQMKRGGEEYKEDKRDCLKIE